MKLLQFHSAVAALISVSGAIAAQGPPVQQNVPRSATVTILIALVDRDMQVRAVPLHALRVVGGSDSTVTRTGIDGRVSVVLLPGKYTVTSVAGSTFQDRVYRWNAEVVAVANRTIELSLTNDNATTESLSLVPSPTALDRIDGTARIFTQFQSSVFRVQAGLAQGSAFLADTLGGVIITNSHVVDGVEDEALSVVLDSATRVRARILARDPEADIAILHVSAERIRGRTRISLQRLTDRPPVQAGERLAAMGFPLNQGLTITSGIASSVRAGAIISDVNINHGNSGGPLLNVDGEVVAVNTFGDFTSQGGPGVSGSILIARAGPALARAATALAMHADADATVLPSMPLDRFDVTTLKVLADTIAPRNYRKFTGIALGGFDVTVQTPVQTIVAAKAFENDVAMDRKKRERLANLPEGQRYSEVREYRDWGEYVGQPTAPVVSISIIPRIGETGGSMFARAMLGANLKATYKFQGDVRGATLYRNGIAVEPIKGGHAPTKVYVDNQWVSLKDVADQGFYIYDPETFAPDNAGIPPQIVLAVRDLKNPKKLRCREIDKEVVAQAWNDFATYYGAQRGIVAVRSDPKTANGRKSAFSTGFMKTECEWAGAW